MDLAASDLGERCGSKPGKRSRRHLVPKLWVPAIWPVNYQPPSTCTPRTCSVLNDVNEDGKLVFDIDDEALVNSGNL